MSDQQEKLTIGIGSRIKKARNDKGLSQKDVAKLSGISHSAYVKIELGETEKIFIEVGKNIAKALSISFNELFNVDSFHTESDYIHRILQLEKENERLKDQLEDKKEIIRLLNTQINTVPGK